MDPRDSCNCLLQVFPVYSTLCVTPVRQAASPAAIPHKMEEQSPLTSLQQVAILGSNGDGTHPNRIKLQGPHLDLSDLGTFVFHALLSLLHVQGSCVHAFTAHAEIHFSFPEFLGTRAFHNCTGAAAVA